MTGQRPSARGRGDPWRGARPAPVTPHHGDPELEDLPTGQVIRRGRHRATVSSAFATLALVGLLAGGFGVLGGRPDGPPSTGPDRRAAALGGGPSPAGSVDRPQAELRVIGTGLSIPTVEGCDVVLTLRAGNEQRSGCDRDLSTLPGPPQKLAEGALVDVGMAGWVLTDLIVICGSQADRVFSARQPGCLEEVAGTTFTAPKPGDWTVAIAACAVDAAEMAADRICGTWYAAIDTRPATPNEPS